MFVNHPGLVHAILKRESQNHEHFANAEKERAARSLKSPKVFTAFPNEVRDQKRMNEQQTHMKNKCTRNGLEILGWRGDFNARDCS